MYSLDALHGAWVRRTAEELFALIEVSSTHRFREGVLINTVVVGYGLAGRVFHCPLLDRRKRLLLSGVVARDPGVRAEAEHAWNVKGYASLNEALEDDSVELIVIATPHDVHADQVVRTLEAGKNCVVDKVMALTSAEADLMIAARDRSRKMLSVFHNRRWDGDFLTLKAALAKGLLGKPLLFESSVVRYARPRTWRGEAGSAGTILHDWGAHLVDQALGLGLGSLRGVSCWIVPAPWPGVDSGGHGRLLLEFESGVVFQIETSRISGFEKPRWLVLGTEGCYRQFGLDPQEDALRSGNLDAAIVSPEHYANVARSSPDGGELVETLAPIPGNWDRFYENIKAHLCDGEPLEVAAEQGRAVVEILESAAADALCRSR